MERLVRVRISMERREAKMRLEIREPIRWLERFELDRFYIIDSTDLRTRPKVLSELDGFGHWVSLQYRHE